jgi:hypothetical protein
LLKEPDDSEAKTKKELFRCVLCFVFFFIVLHGVYIPSGKKAKSEVVASSIPWLTFWRVLREGMRTFLSLG